MDCRPLIAFCVRRVRATLCVGGLRLRPLGTAALRTTARLSAGLAKFTRHTARLRVRADLSASLAKGTTHTAALGPIQSRLLAQAVKATAHQAPLQAEAQFAAALAKTTQSTAPLATTARLAVRLQRSGYTRITSDGSRRTTSTLDPRILVQITPA